MPLIAREDRSRATDLVAALRRLRERGAALARDVARIDYAPGLALLTLVFILGGDLVVWVLQHVAPGAAAPLAALGRGKRMLFLGGPLAASLVAVAWWLHARRVRRARWPGK